MLLYCLHIFKYLSCKAVSNNFATQSITTTTCTTSKPIPKYPMHNLTGCFKSWLNSKPNIPNISILIHQLRALGPIRTIPLVRSATFLQCCLSIQCKQPIKSKSLLLSLIHISEPTRLGMISYAVFCLKKKKKKNKKKKKKKIKKKKKKKKKKKDKKKEKIKIKKIKRKTQIGKY